MHRRSRVGDMLTYRTGSAGTPRAARNMAEHLLQETHPPGMAVMADYYEQGVTVLPAGGRRAAGGDALNDLAISETVRMGESALAPDGSTLPPDELRLRTAATFIAAGRVTREEGAMTLSCLGADAAPSSVFEAQLNAAFLATPTAGDHTSVMATPRRQRGA